MHDITLIGESGRNETLEGLVDTGSTFSTVPRAVLESLDVKPVFQARLRLADGRSVVSEVGEVTAQIFDLVPRTIFVVFGSNDGPVLIGAQALENFMLGVDPDQRRLVPVEGWWA